MAEYKGNAFAQKNLPEAQNAPAQPKEDKKVQAVVSGKVVLKEPSKLEKIKVSGKNAAIDLFNNTIVPALRDLVYRGICNFSGSMLYKDGNRPYPNARGSASSIWYGSERYTDYGARYGQPKAVRVASDPIFKNPILPTMDDALAVLDGLRACIDSYDHFATWADLYDLCNMNSSNWQGLQKYGWTNVESTTINTITMADGSVGYELRMPKAIPIDQDEPPFDVR